MNSSATAAVSNPGLSFKLSGQKAVVTGGNAGIGEAITVALVEAGADIAVLGRSIDKFNAMMTTHALDSKKVAFFAVDLSDATATVSAAKQALEWAGGYINILVNNAGVALNQPLAEISVQDWDKTMAVNVRAPMLVAQVVAPAMLEHGKGKIINISSQASKVGLRDHGAYCASKAALDALTRVMTVEYAQRGIQCNTINPTVVLTSMGKQVWGNVEKGGPMLERIPAGRFAEPWEVANLAVYLATDCSGILQGQSLFLDGGVTAAVASNLKLQN